MKDSFNNKIDKIISENFENTNLGSIVFSLLSKEQKKNFFAEIHGYKSFDDMNSVFIKTLYKKKKFSFLYPDNKYFSLDVLHSNLQKNLNDIYKKYILIIIKNLNSEGFIDIDNWEELSENDIYDLLSLNYNEFEKSLQIPSLSKIDSVNFISNKKKYLTDKEKEILEIINDVSIQNIETVNDLSKRNVYAIFEDNVSYEDITKNSILIKEYNTITSDMNIEHFFHRQRQYISNYFKEITFFSNHFKKVILQKQKLFQEIDMQYNHQKVYIIDLRKLSINELKEWYNNIPFHLFSQGRAIAMSYLLIFNEKQKKEIMIPGAYQKLKAYILP